MLRLNQLRGSRMSFEQIVVVSGNYLIIFLVLVIVSAVLAPTIKRFEFSMFGNSYNYPPKKSSQRIFLFAATTHMFLMVAAMFFALLLAVLGLKDLSEFLMRDIFMTQHGLLIVFVWWCGWIDDDSF